MENWHLESFFSSTMGIVLEVGSLNVQHSQMNGEFWTVKLFFPLSRSVIWLFFLHSLLDSYEAKRSTENVQGMHRKKINRRTEIGNFCISLLSFLETFSFLLSLLNVESELLLQSNKGFHQQMCFLKNVVLSSCRTAVEGMELHSYCVEWCSFTGTLKGLS